VGEPLATLLGGWHAAHAGIALTISEMNDRELAAALEGRHVDIIITFLGAVPRNLPRLSLYREPILAAVSAEHDLALANSLSWQELKNENVLIQGCAENRPTHDLYSSFLGAEARFCSHAASKQALFALVSAGFGITLATGSQSSVAFPGVVFKPIREPNAFLELELVWRQELEDAAVGCFVAFMRDQIRSTGFC
jgi:DNA-binding transcriptional LysR family regulator